MNLHKKTHAFRFQIAELREYILYLDQQIARYRKQGRDPARLIENKAHALRTIQELKQANREPLTKKR